MLREILLLPTLFVLCCFAGATRAWSSMPVNAVLLKDDIEIELDITPADCNQANGLIRVTARGGDPPYRYSLDGINYQSNSQFRDLEAGVYGVYVLDDEGELEQVNATVVNQTTLSLALANTRNPYCGDENGVINLQASGGNPPYQFTLDRINFQSSPHFKDLAPGNYTAVVIDGSGCESAISVPLPADPPPSLEVTNSVAPSCELPNGRINVRVTDGKPPFRYTLNGGAPQPNPTFGSLLPGSYTIEVSDDNGCQGSLTVLLQAAALPVLSVIATENASCDQANASVTLGMSGGSAPYLYSLDGENYQAESNFTGLSAGDYTFYGLDDTGCPVETTFTVLGTTSPVPEIQQINQPGCNFTNGSFTIAVSGGTLPMAFSLNGVDFQSNNQFQGLSPGDYLVTVRDGNGCSATLPIALISQGFPSLEVVNTQAAGCSLANGSIQLHASGGLKPYQFSLDGINFQSDSVFNNLAAGDYAAWIRDQNNCPDQTSVTVGNTPQPQIAVSTKRDAHCGLINGSVTLTGSQGAPPYQYSLDGQRFQTSSTFSNLAAGDYTAIIRDANNCTAEANFTIIDISVIQVSASRSTPANCGQDNGTFTVTAILGTPPYEYSIDGQIFQANPTFINLAAGSYSVTVRDADNCSDFAAVTVFSIGGPEITIAATTPAACGQSIGTVTLSAENGQGPYQYSLDGSTFQLGSTFTNLGTGDYTAYVKDADNCIDQESFSISDLSGPQISIGTIRASNCGQNNGSATLLANQGTPPYQFSINGLTFQGSPLFANVAGGSYTAIVRDANNCTSTTSFSIADLSGPQVAIVSTTPSTCGRSNGSVTLSSTQGTPPYQFSIDGDNFQLQPVFSGLTAGNYTATVKDANNCLHTGTFTIQETLPPQIVVSTTAPTSCGGNNGAVTLSGSSGTTPYRFAIDGGSFQNNPTFNNLAAGSHSAILRDANNCEVTIGFSITALSDPQISVGVLTPAACGQNNGAVTLVASQGTPPYQYALDGSTFQPQPVFTNLFTGNYTATVRDANNCIRTLSFSIGNLNGPQLSISTNTSASCGRANGSVTLLATQGTPPYQYSFDGLNFQSSPIFTGLDAGDYSVLVRDFNGCIAQNTFTIEQINTLTLAVSETTPAACGQNKGAVSLLATLGLPPYQYSIDGNTFQISPIFLNLSAGNYTATARDVNGCIDTARFVISNLDGPQIAISESTPSACGQNNGAATFLATLGTPPYQYSIDDTTFQDSPIFLNLPAGNYTATAKDANGCSNSVNFVISNLDGPQIAISETTPTTCGQNNGAATFLATLGTPPYQYSIDDITFQDSPIFPNLPAGNYIATVKDANACINTTGIVITGSSALAISISELTLPACGTASGSISVQVSGGTGEISFSLDEGVFQTASLFDKLSAGSHSLTVRDQAGCSLATTFVLAGTNGPSPVLSAIKAAHCGQENGQIIVGATNGIGPFSYSINGTNFQTSGTFSRLSSGSYSVFVRDGSGCLGRLNNIIVPKVDQLVLVIDTIITPESDQAKGSISVSAQGGEAPYVYRLNEGAWQDYGQFSELKAGAFRVESRDQLECTTGLSFQIPATRQPLTAFISNVIQPTCGQTNGSIAVTAGGGIPPYRYRIGNGSFQTGPVFNNLAPGFYQIEVSDALNTIREVVVELEQSPAFQITVSNIVSPGCNQKNGAISLQVLSGTPPFAFSLNNGPFLPSHTLENLAGGQYHIQAVDGNNCPAELDILLEEKNSLNLSITILQAAGCSSPLGTLTAGASGGQGPYQYFINGKLLEEQEDWSSIPPGTYVLSVLDAGQCSAWQTFTMPDLKGPVWGEISLQKPACGSNNGSISVALLPGQSISFNGRAFSEQSVFEGLTAASYQLRLQGANGCRRDTTILLPDAGDLQLEVADFQHASCNQSNGKLLLHADGGSGNYRYLLTQGQWQTDPQFSGLKGGLYFAWAEDQNGCRALINFELPKDTLPKGAADILTSESLLCPQDFMLIEGNTLENWSGSWSAQPEGLLFDNPISARTALSAAESGEYQLVWSLRHQVCPIVVHDTVEIIVPEKPVLPEWETLSGKNGQASILQLTTVNKEVNDISWSVAESSRKGEAFIEENTLIYFHDWNEFGLDSMQIQYCDAQCQQLCTSTWISVEVKGTEEFCDPTLSRQSIFPGGITPNEDGENDQLEFIIIDRSTCPFNYAQSELAVYNRWGDLIYLESPYNNNWKGTNFQGEPLPVGVYYYALKINLDKEFVRFGSVTLLR